MKGRERVIINQMNIGTVSKATLGKLLRDGLITTITIYFINPSEKLKLSFDHTTKNISQ